MTVASNTESRLLSLSEDLSHHL